MNKVRQLAGQTLVYGLGTIVPRLLNYLLLTPFYTRIFQTGEYGVFTELYSYVAFLAVLLTYGMETAFFRFAEENDHRKVYHTSLISLVGTSLLFLIPTLLFAGDIAQWIRYPQQVWYVRVFAIIIAVDAILSIPFARLRQQNRAMWFSTVKIINLLLNIGLNIFFLVLCPAIHAKNPESAWLFFYNPDLGVGWAFIANLMTSLVTAVLLLPQLKVSFRWFDQKLLRSMLNYAWPLLLVGLAGMINDVADKIFLKFLVADPADAASQVGIYGANYKLAMIMTMFTQMFRFAADPFFFSQMKDENRNTTYAQVTRYFVITGLLIFLLVMLFIDFARLFIGPAFHSGLKIVPIVLLANLFYGITYNLSFWYKLSGKTIYGAYITGIGAGVTLLLNILLVPRMGYMGAAIATLLCYSVMMVVSYVWGQNHLPVDYGLKRLGIYFALALALYGTKALLPVGEGLYGFLTGLGLLLVFGVVVVRAEGLNPAFGVLVDRFRAMAKR